MPAITWDTIKAGLHAWVVAGSGLDADHVIYSKQVVNRPLPPYIEISLTESRQPSHDWVRRRRNPLLGQGPAAVTPVTVNGSQLVKAGHGFVTGDGAVTVESTGAEPSPLQANTRYWVVVDDANRLRLASSFQKTGGNYVGNPIETIALTDAGSGALQIRLDPKASRAGKAGILSAQGIRVLTWRLTMYAVDGGGDEAIQILIDTFAALPLHSYELNQSGLGTAGLGIFDLQQGIRTIPGIVAKGVEPRAFVDFTAYTGTNVEGFVDSIEKMSVTAHAVVSDGGDEITLPTQELDVT